MNGYTSTFISKRSLWDEDKRHGGDLYRHLRCKIKRKKRYGSYDRRGQIPNRVSIDERPSEVDKRIRIGDWEGDTIIGKGHRQAIVSLSERKSRLSLIQSERIPLGKVEQKTAEQVSRAVTKLLMPMKDRVYTLTSDNGKEFARHEEIARELEAGYFFAHS